MLEVAALDAGSNAIRFVCLKVNEQGRQIDFFFKRYALRLGQEVFERGTISKSSQQKLIRIFTEIKKRLEKRGIRHFKAVATAAFRQAKNKKSIIQKIMNHTGIRLTVISGKHEAQLSKWALRRAVANGFTDALYLDLGGGSLEIGKLSQQKGHSLPLGTLRVLQHFPQLNDSLYQDDITRIMKKLALKLQAKHILRFRAQHAICTGGNFDAIVKIIPGTGFDYESILANKLPALLKKMATMTVKKRQVYFNLRPDRADSILPAIIVLLTIARLTGVHHFIVPKTGLREALLWQLIEKHSTIRTNTLAV